MTATMRTRTLNGQWRLNCFEESKPAPHGPEELENFPGAEISATVPGNVELDLVAAGMLPEDLFHRDNILKLKEYESYQWWYTREFPTPEWHGESETELVFDGLDCFATVWINGREAGRSANALIGHRFNITPHLKESGSNSIAIRLEAPLNAVKDRPLDVMTNANMTQFERLWARKPAHCYGWDIMPRAVSAGIWRDVRLCERRKTELDEVFIDTLSTSAEEAVIVVYFQFHTGEPLRDFSLRVRGECGESTFEKTMTFTFVGGNFRINVANPRLWWPRGYGNPDLYQVKVELLHRGEPVSTRDLTLGIRTVELERTELSLPDQPGRFHFIVNGEFVFCRGSNWVPADVFHSRDPERIPRILDLFREMECNMLRCWGGNVYEDHAFFEICDREGIMVWQDFAMACAYFYPQHLDFLDIISEEVEWVVKNLRQHPSLVLWCGDNEVDTCAESAHRFWGDRYKDANDNRITREALPEVLRRLDSLRPYVPSSPYIGPSAHAVKRDKKVRVWMKKLIPEQHYYPPFDKKEIMETTAAFMGETGFKAFPDPASIRQFLGQDAHLPYVGNPVWSLHSTETNPSSPLNARIDGVVQSVESYFGKRPDTLEDLTLASQIVQAEALKFIVELFRQRKERTSGILWWNMMDGWPQFSDAVVDYYFRKKPAFHYLKRVHAPLAVMIAEPEGGFMDIVAVNDSRVARHVKITIRDLDGPKPLLEEKFLIPANGREYCGKLPVPGDSPKLYLIDWEEAGGERGTNHYLYGEPPFDFARYRAEWLPALNMPYDRPRF